jgi:alpha-ribazole phosphatase
MKVVLVRHGKTQGNLEKRYVGRTDEPLSELGKEELAEKVSQNSYPKIKALIVSPMIRCRETAAIIYNDIFTAGNVIVEQALKEMDFGNFEYKNFEELDGDAEYQAYLDSGGYRDFPKGESLKAFEDRCVKGFQRALKSAEEQLVQEKGVKPAADEEVVIGVVAHGGTIMALMNRLCTTKKSYYDWMLDNGAFYVCEWTGESLCLQDV